MPHACPLAMYLKSVTDDDTESFLVTGVHILVFRTTGPTWLSMPRGCSEFVQRFDNGEYQELIGK